MPNRMKFFAGLMAYTTILRALPCLITAYDAKIDPSVIYYPWNFVPLTAMCLYAGAYFSDRRLSFGLPLLTVLISDLAIGLLNGHLEWASPIGRWSAYLSYAIIILMGSGLGRRAWPARAVDALTRGIVAETLFFLVTNFAVFLSQTTAPYTVAGLMTCYIAGIPFAGKAFVSTAIYSVLLFSPLAVRAAGGTSEATETVAAEPTLAQGKSQ